MSQVTLTADSGGGSVAIAGPSTTTGNAALTLALPGTASGTIATTSGVAFSSYAVICDKKAQDVDGGTFTSGDWRTRDLNHEITDADSIVTISSNQFTLGAGTYFIMWYAPAFRCGRHQSRLYDITGSAVIQYGRSGNSDTGGDGDMTDSDGFSRVTIGSNNVYEIQHQCSTTEATIGLGNASNFVDTEIFTTVYIKKEA